MKDDKLKPSLSIKKGGEFVLSKKALVELLQAVLDKGLPFRFNAKGFSMSPFIKNNDLITISPLKYNYPRRGDIVAYIHPKTRKLTVHRMIRKKGDFYLIKGDNTPETDGFISLRSIIGYVTCVERRGKKLFLSLGPEKYLIAFFTSKGLFTPIKKTVSKLLSLIKKRGYQHE